jgi:4-amino-4-deoxy-L-arabinose transferase-like glycosyltransferase
MNPAKLLQPGIFQQLQSFQLWTTQKWALFVLVIACALLPIMPSHQSLWIDEAYTAHMARQPTFTALIQEFAHGHDSHHQMPLGMGFAWAAAKVIGTSEWQLRAPNLLWGALTLLAMFFIGKDTAMPWLPLLAAVHPFFWRYTDEARPYAMQIAAGAWLCYALINLIKTKGLSICWAVLLCFAGFLLCGSSLLGVIPFACAVSVMTWLVVRNRWRPSPAACRWLAGGAALQIPLAAFYLWSLSKGASASRAWSVTWANPAFTFYELFGFAGLGPARDEIRHSALSSHAGLLRTFLPYLATIGFLIGAYGFVIWGLLTNRLRSRHLKAILYSSCSVVIIAVGGLSVIAVLTRWPFWGRHVAALFAFVITALALGLQKFNTRPRLHGALCFAFFGLLAISSWEIRFAQRHRRDDYRTAASMARAQLSTGKVVWWCADLEAARYYGLNSSADYQKGLITSAFNLSRPDCEDLGKAAAPDFVVYSKPEICDRNRVVGNMVTSPSWHLVSQVPAFAFYAKSSTPAY